MTGIPLYMTEHTREFYASHGVSSTLVRKMHDEGEPNVGTLLSRGAFDLVISIPEEYARTSDDVSAAVRRTAASFAVPLLANVQLAKAFLQALVWSGEREIQVKAWDEYR